MKRVSESKSGRCTAVSGSAVLLVLSILLSLLSCSGDTALHSTSEAETKLFMLPKELSYSGEHVRVLASGTSMPEYGIKEEGETVVSQALVFRNAALRERLGVSISFMQRPCSTENERTAFLDAVRASVCSGSFEDRFDLIVADPELSVKIAISGCVRDLLEAEYIRSDVVCSEGSPLGSALINDRLYFLFGAFSPSYTRSLSVICASTELLKEKGVSDEMLFETVLNGDFTLQKLIEYSEGYYRDENENGLSDGGDTYGFLCSDVQSTALFFGADGRLIGTEKGKFELDDRFCGNTALAFFEMLCAWKSDKACGIGFHGQTAFSEGHTLFSLLTVSQAVSESRNLENGTAVLLPLPKGTETQENYRTPIGENAMLYSMSAACSAERADLLCAVLGVLWEEGEKTVVPALYERFYHDGSYEAHAPTAEIFREIVSSAVFDYGYTAPSFFGYRFKAAVYEYMYNHGRGGFRLYAETVADGIGSDLEALNEAFRKVIK